MDNDSKNKHFEITSISHAQQPNYYQLSNTTTPTTSHRHNRATYRWAKGAYMCFPKQTHLPFSFLYFVALVMQTKRTHDSVRRKKNPWTRRRNRQHAVTQYLKPTTASCCAYRMPVVGVRCNSTLFCLWLKKKNLQHPKAPANDVAASSAQENRNLAPYSGTLFRSSGQCAFPKEEYGRRNKCGK